VERRVKVIYSAEIQGYKQAMEQAAQANAKAKKAADDAGKAADQAADEVKKQGLAHQAAAKAAGVQYDNTGQLVTMNGKALSSQQAAALGLQSFSKEAYLAGRAAVDAGDEAAAAAKKAEEAEKAAAESAKKHKEALKLVGEQAAIGGAAVLAGVGMAVKAYADFDKQMSVVDSATHETAENMALLRQAAIDAGADTAFSATEAGQGIEELAKAGVSTKDILGGGLSGALSLAAAGSLGVGEAAEIAASALTQFKLSGDKVPHLADLLAAGAGKAQGSVHDLGMALNQSGLVAASTGLTIEETTGTLAAFASAGLTGSDAGTSFKTMLMSLNPNSKQAAALMDQLGIHAYDAQGKFVGMSEYAGILQNALKGLTDEQRNATLKTLFGTDAVRAANIVYQEGADGITKWEDAVNEAGYAADTAARMQNNLAGDLEKLGGSFDTVLIQSGSGANEVLRGLVQGLEGVVDAVGKVPAPVLGAATGLAALVGGAALVVGGLITVIPKVNETRKALNELAPAGSKARAGLETAGKFAERAAAALTAVAIAAKLASEATNNDRAKTSVEDFNNALTGVATKGDAAKKALDAAFNGVTKPGNSSFTAVNDLDSALKRVFNPSFNDNMNDFWSTVTGNNATSGINVTKAALSDMDKSLAGLAKSGNLKDAAAGFQLAAKAAEAQGKPVSDLIKLFPEYKSAILDAKTANGETQVSQEALADAMLKGEVGSAKAASSIKGVGDAASAASVLTEEQTKALEDMGLKADGTVLNLDKFTQALVNAGLLTLSSRDATAKFDEALDGLDQKTKDIMATQAAHGGVLNETKTDLDLYSEAGRAANDVLADMTQKGIGAAEAMAKNGDSMPAVQDQLSKTYDAMVRTAEGFGLGKDEAENLTRSILHVPPGVDVHSWMSDEAKRMAEQTTGALNQIDGRVVRTYTVNEEKTIKIEQRATLPDLNGDASGTGRPGLAVGGRVPGYADGGQLPTNGPGTSITDGFLGIDSVGMPRVRVDAGEWIINPNSSDRYNRELAAINAGTFPKLPGFANGGREFAAQSFGYAPSAGAGAAAFEGNLYLDSGEFLGKVRGVARQEAAGVVSAADSQAALMRTGRRP